MAKQGSKSSFLRHEFIDENIPTNFKISWTTHNWSKICSDPSIRHFGTGLIVLSNGGFATQHSPRQDLDEDSFAVYDPYLGDDHVSQAGVFLLL